MSRLPAKAILTCAFAIALIGALMLPQSGTAQTYQVRPGDVLLVEVLEDPTLNRSVLVAPDGRITVPLAGSIQVSGQSVEGVQRSLTARLASGFTNPPNVFVSLERPTERKRQDREPNAPPLISVFVMGEAMKPGMLSLPPKTTLLQAFAVMGGFTKFAAQKRIQLRRTNSNDDRQTITSLNYKQIEAGAEEGRLILQDGDVIVVPQRRLFE